MVTSCPAGPSPRRLGVLLHAGSGQMEKTKLRLDLPWKCRENKDPQAFSYGPYQRNFNFNFKRPDVLRSRDQLKENSSSSQLRDLPQQKGSLEENMKHLRTQTMTCMSHLKVPLKPLEWHFDLVWFSATEIDQKVTISPKVCLGMEEIKKSND